MSINTTVITFIKGTFVPSISPTTANVSSTSTKSSDCVFAFADLKFERIFIGVCAIIFGILYLCIGYRILKLLFYVTGFLLLGVIVFNLLWFNAGLSLSVSLLVACLAGSLLSVLSGCVAYCGYFTVGTAFGVQLGSLTILVLDQFSLIKQYWLVLCLITIPMLIMGILSLCFRRCLSIFSTTVWASMLLIFSIDCFVENYLISFSLWVILTSITPNSQPTKLCFQSYIILSCIPIIIIAGVIFQFKVSAKDFEHEDKVYRCCQTSVCCSRSATPRVNSHHGSTRFLNDAPSSPQQYQHSWHRLNQCGISGQTVGPGHHYSSVPSATLSSLKNSGSEYGTGGRKTRTIGNHSPVDPVADKFCHLYRIRQIQGDVPSQDAFQTFQLRHSGYYGNGGSMGGGVNIA